MGWRDAEVVVGGGMRMPHVSGLRHSGCKTYGVLTPKPGFSCALK